jgi:hypothetical protein
MWFSLSFPGPFDKTFGRLMIPSHTEGLTVLSASALLGVEGLTGESSALFVILRLDRGIQCC